MLEDCLSGQQIQTLYASQTAYSNNKLLIINYNEHKLYLLYSSTGLIGWVVSGSGMWQQVPRRPKLNKVLSKSVNIIIPTQKQSNDTTKQEQSNSLVKHLYSFCFLNHVKVI